MTTILAESVLKLSELRAMLPVPKTRQALTDWITKGIVGADGQRHRLEATRIGRAWHTSTQAVARFLERTSALPN